MKKPRARSSGEVRLDRRKGPIPEQKTHESDPYKIEDRNKIYY